MLTSVLRNYKRKYCLGNCIFYFSKVFKCHLGCVWFRREVVKREISKREYEKRVKGEK